MAASDAEAPRPRRRISIWYIMDVGLVLIGIVACSLPATILVARHRYPSSSALSPLPVYQSFGPVKHGVFYRARVRTVTLKDYLAVTKWYQQRGWNCDGACEIYFDYRLGQWRIQGYGLLTASYGDFYSHPLFLDLYVEQSVTFASP